MTALLVGLGCFAAHVAVTLVWLRATRGPSPVVRHAASALGTHALGVLVGAWVAGPVAYWPAAAVSGFGAVCWLFAFSAVYKSVSLRILSQLSRTPGHALPFEVIARDYVRPEFEARVAVLVKMNCAEEAASGYAATAAGKATARRIAGIQRACGIEASGLYGGAVATQSSP
jgi:hypothetical protein